MDALVKAAQQRQPPRDLAIFLTLATQECGGSRCHASSPNPGPPVGLRKVPVKGRKTRDIPLPTAVMEYLNRYVSQCLPTEVEDIKPDTPLFWSTFGQRRQGSVRRPMEGKNIWRFCKTYGCMIGYPMLKPHDLTPRRGDGGLRATP